MPQYAIRLPHQEELLDRYLRALLGAVDEATIVAIRDKLRWVQLVGGEVLMRQGEPGDCLYVLVSGRLRVYIEDGVRPHVVREIGRGEVVGEMSLYTDQPRSATLIAIRDSVLVRLDRAAFDWLIEHRPQVSQALARQIIERLHSERGHSVIDKPVTMALLPITPGLDMAGLTRDLAQALASKGRVHTLTSAVMDEHLRPHGLSLGGEGDPQTRRAVAMLLDEIESTHDYVLLVGDGDATGWTDLCARHADEILLAADATQAPLVHESERRFLVDRPPRAEALQVLLLLHPPGTAAPSRTERWLARRPVGDHVHVRLGHAGDMARLARIQSRSAVGLVFAGGGARGFAHLGVHRALTEAGIEVDYVGGTSIGSVMAALVASDHAHEAIIEVTRQSFARSPTDDFSLLPLVSLLKGRKLRRIVGEAVSRHIGPQAGIEDLWKGYFCIATNYSTASEVVLRRGDLVKAMLASIAIPGMLPPVVMDGDLLCDGGTFNNFPVDVMRRLRGVATVVGVDLNVATTHKQAFDEIPPGWRLLLDRLRPRAKRRYRLPGLSSLLVNTTVLYSMSRQQQARAQTDIYFNPPLERVGMLDWSKFDSVVAQGYEHAREVLAARAAGAKAEQERAA